MSASTTDAPRAAGNHFAIGTARDEKTTERVIAIVLPRSAPDTLVLSADEARALARRLFERAALCDLDNGIPLA